MRVDIQWTEPVTVERDICILRIPVGHKESIRTRLQNLFQEDMNDEPDDDSEDDDWDDDEDEDDYWGNDSDWDDDGDGGDGI